MRHDDDNPRTRVKICGLTTLEDARYASGAMADFLGFIFYSGSKRYVDPDQAAAIIAWIEGPETVGVFVNQPLDDVVDVAGKTGIDLIQLHGQESPEYCSLMPKPVIKAIPVEVGDDARSLEAKIRPYERSVAYILLDTVVGGQSGGTGQSFDWDILEDLDISLPWFLAGGIGPDNVAAAVRAARPFAVDANSKLESEPGVKQLEKFEAFFEAMQKLWRTQDPD